MHADSLSHRSAGTRGVDEAATTAVGLTLDPRQYSLAAEIREPSSSGAGGASERLNPNGEEQPSLPATAISCVLWLTARRLIGSVRNTPTSESETIARGQGLTGRRETTA